MFVYIFASALAAILALIAGISTKSFKFSLVIFFVTFFIIVTAFSILNPVDEYRKVVVSTAEENGEVIGLDHYNGRYYISVRLSDGTQKRIETNADHFECLSVGDDILIRTQETEISKLHALWQKIFG